MTGRLLATEENAAKKIHKYCPLHALSSLEKLALIWVNSPMNEAPPADWFRMWNGARLRYCTDGAANHIMAFCKDNLIKPPHLIAGDFDSITPEAKEYFAGRSSKLIHVHDQHTTDLTKTLRLVAKTVEDEQLNVRSIVLLGGLHGRFDHVFGALNAAILHNNTQKSNKLPVFFVDHENIVTVLQEGQTSIELDGSRITGVCGLLPISQCETVVTTSGFRWNLSEQLLQFGGIVSSSNEVVDEKNLVVSTTAPIVFTFELKDHNKIC